MNYEDSMPTYTKHCNECDEIFDVVCKIAEKTETHKTECPYCDGLDSSWMLSAPNFTMRSERLMKTRSQDNGFKEVIAKIAERNPRTSVAKRV